MLGRSGMAPLPDPVAMRILPDGAGFALMQLDKAGASIAHTWYPTLAEAKDAAAKAYGVAESEWMLEGAGLA